MKSEQQINTLHRESIWSIIMHLHSNTSCTDHLAYTIILFRSVYCYGYHCLSDLIAHCNKVNSSMKNIIYKKQANIVAIIKGDDGLKPRCDDLNSRYCHII